MGLKIWCQVWVWGTQFSKLHHVREFSSIWFQKLSFFFRLGSGVLKIHQFFRKYQVFKFTAGRWLFFLVLKVHFLRGWAVSLHQGPPVGGLQGAQGVGYSAGGAEGGCLGGGPQEGLEGGFSLWVCAVCLSAEQLPGLCPVGSQATWAGYVGFFFLLAHLKTYGEL